jgi:hypothetical protein
VNGEPIDDGGWGDIGAGGIGKPKRKNREIRENTVISN